MMNTRIVAGAVAAMLVAGCAQSPAAPDPVKRPPSTARSDESPPPPPPADVPRGVGGFGSGT
jgi:uncharacterized lipoprotein